MRKIPTLFKRDFNNNGQITPEYNEGTEWVVNGEGKATQKIDGTSVLIRDQKMYKRHEVKDGRDEPFGFELAAFDETTGKKMGWVEVGNGSEDKWHREATGGLTEGIDLPDGTYELLGPKIQGNPENIAEHSLWKHTAVPTFDDVPVEFEALKEWLSDLNVEGIVWHHPDGRMVKIKKKDFRLKR